MLTSHVWLSRLTAGLLIPMIMAKNEFRFLNSRQLQTNEHTSKKWIGMRLKSTLSSYRKARNGVRVKHVCGHRQVLLTVQRSWWTSWGAGLSCWAVRRGTLQWRPTVEPGWISSGTSPDSPWSSWSSAGQTCGRAARAEERREEALGEAGLELIQRTGPDPCTYREPGEGLWKSASGERPDAVIWRWHCTRNGS